MATYPGGTATFTAKRNLLDDVMAEHVNTLQDEVKAIQTAIGTMPYLDRTLNQVENNYGSVRGRMEAIQRGLSTPVIMLQSGNENVATATDVDINFDTPNVTFDTNAMFDGIGFTINRGGWWIVTADVSWANNASGARGQFLMANNIELSGMTVMPTPGWPTRTNVTFQGPLVRGRKITTRVRHTAGVTLGLNVTLNASFVRELPGVQVY